MTTGPEQVEAIYRRVTECNACFASGHLKRGFVDIAQPRYVGPKYWTAEHRLLFLSINPGAGKGSADDQAMRVDIHAFKAGNLDLGTLFERQRGYFPKWGNGKFLLYFQQIGVDLNEIALLNLAHCATLGDQYPSEMLRGCMDRHTKDLIEVLRPDRLVACGQRVQEVAMNLKLPFIGIPHYAARTRIDFARVRENLGISSEAAAPSPMKGDEIQKQRPHLNKQQTRVIRLLEPINPKSGMSRHRYDCYRDGMTIEDYTQAVTIKCGVVEAKKCLPDIKWDSERNFIRIQLG